MPFYRCKNCGKLYSDEHKECPHCVALSVPTENQDQEYDQNYNQNRGRSNVGCVIASGCGGLSVGIIIGLIVVFVLIASFFAGIIEFFFDLLNSL
jgi:hypothetical protein